MHGHINVKLRSEVNNAWQIYRLRGTPQVYTECNITKLYKIVKKKKQLGSRLSGGCKTTCIVGCVEL